MEQAIAIILAGILIAGVLLYGRSKRRENRYNRILRDDLQRRQNSGKDGLCPVGFDSDGQWFSISRRPSVTID